MVILYIQMSRLSRVFNFDLHLPDSKDNHADHPSVVWKTRSSAWTH